MNGIKGDTCVMITNKTKNICEYTVESYDGRYFWSTKSYWTLSSSFTVENVSYKGGRRLKHYQNQKNKDMEE